jgi:hypothetical protein
MNGRQQAHSACCRRDPGPALDVREIETFRYSGTRVWPVQVSGQRSGGCARDVSGRFTGVGHLCVVVLRPRGKSLEGSTICRPPGPITVATIMTMTTASCMNGGTTMLTKALQSILIHSRKQTNVW